MTKTGDRTAATTTGSTMMTIYYRDNRRWYFYYHSYNDDFRSHEGVVVVITDVNYETQSLTTDSNGFYEVTVLDGETEIDVQSPSGGTLTAGNPRTVEVPVGGFTTDQDGIEFGGMAEGTVFLDSDGDSQG